MENLFPAQPVPAHVPEALVRPFPFVFGTVTDSDPFNEWTPEVHKGPEIFWTPHAYPGGTPAWIVRRTEHLRKIYSDTEHFSSRDFTPYARLIGESWTITPVEVDPPQHGIYRSFVNPLFTPRAVAGLEEKIRGYAAEYIEAFRATGECEFMKQFAFEFPIKVVLELMGLPLDQTKQFLAWEHDLLHQADLGQMAAATRAVVDYLRAQIDDRRINPRDDIISYAVNTEIDGGRKLTDDELVGFCFNLFIGGLDTVTTNTGAQILHLAQNPEHQAFLRAHPEAIPDAVEEMLRAYAAVTTFRTVTKELVFKGVRMMPGDKVAMSTTLAGRDPEEFANPNELILDRKPRHVSFAFGPHFCVGMHLARRELKIAIEEFLARIPPFQVKPGHRIRRHLGVIQLLDLPLVWQA